MAVKFNNKIVLTIEINLEHKALHHVVTPRVIEGVDGLFIDGTHIETIKVTEKANLLESWLKKNK